MYCLVLLSNVHFDESSVYDSKPFHFTRVLLGKSNILNMLKYQNPICHIQNEYVEVPKSYMSYSKCLTY